MFGTIGHAHIAADKKGPLVDEMKTQAYAGVPGFVQGYVLFPEERPDEVFMVAMFTDRDAYYRNADDPAQHKRYLAYRALLEDDPNWTDGEWMSASG